MSALSRLGIAEDAQGGAISPEQQQTSDAFGFKWSQRSTYESPAFQSAIRDWLMARYCGGDAQTVGRWLSGNGKLILDAGCGAGNAALLLFGEHLAQNDYLGVDISSAAAVAAARFRAAGVPGDFLQADLTNLPIPDESIDLAFSEGVLHHTDNTFNALAALTRKVKRGGRVLFYVYAKKAPVREFSDDHIRQHLAKMSDEEAWEALLPLTRLGEALGRLDVQFEVPDDIPYLGIRKGRYDLQRFVYWNIFKLYYRPEFSEAESNHVNFDWYRPLNCHRHTVEEVRAWCDTLHLGIEHLDVQESGITVVSRKHE
jgi:SAM-dependent methyltransferase